MQGLFGVMATDKAAGLYPACFAGGSLRALMDSADPRLIFLESSKARTLIQAWRVTVLYLRQRSEYGLRGVTA